MSRPRRPGLSHALEAAIRNKSRHFALSLERLEDREVFAIDVTTDADVVEDDGFTSLREAIDQANVTDGDVEIVLGSGVFGLSLDGEGYARGDNNNWYGDLDVNRSGLSGTLTIRGAGQGLTTINGNELDRVFQIFGGTVVFQDLTITGGLAEDAGEGEFYDRNDGEYPGFYLDVYQDVAAGGGVLAIQSIVTFENVTVDKNKAVFEADCGCSQVFGDAYGGGVMGSESNLTFVNSTVSNNVAQGSADGYEAGGGGVYITNGALSLYSSKVTLNQALGGDGSGEGYGFNDEIYSGSGSGSSDGSGADGGYAFGGGIAAEGGRYLYETYYSGYAPSSTPFSGGPTSVYAENSRITDNLAQGGDGAFVSVPYSVDRELGGDNDVEYVGYDGGGAAGGGVYLGGGGKGGAVSGEFVYSTISENNAKAGDGASVDMDEYDFAEYLAIEYEGIPYSRNYFYIDAGWGGDAYGGGVELEYGSTAVFDHSTVANNHALGGAGGTISATVDPFDESAPSGTWLVLNRGYEEGGRGARGGEATGGGVDAYAAMLQFDYSTASGNTVTGGAGGSNKLSGYFDEEYYYDGLGITAFVGVSADALGGGVALYDSQASLFNSTIAENIATGGAAASGTRNEVDSPNGGFGLGGGIGLTGYSGSVLFAELTTIAFNQAIGGQGEYYNYNFDYPDDYRPVGGYGGGIYAGGDPAYYDYSLDNPGEGDSGGSAIAAFEGSAGGSVVLFGTLVGDNTASGADNSARSNDVAAQFLYATYSLIENPNGILGPIIGSQLILSQDPMLLPLGDYGGPTQTIALSPSSPAVDPVFSDEGTVPEESVSSFAADDPNAPPTVTDQRGVIRPQDGNGDGFASNDIGAFELEYEPPPREEIPPTEETPREPSEGALPVPPVLPPPVFIPFQTPPLSVGQLATANYSGYVTFPNLKEVWVRLYRVEQRGGRKFSVLVTAIMVQNSDTGLRAALFALRKMPPGLYQITIDLTKSELIIWEGQFPKDVDTVSRRLDQVENVLRNLQGPEQFRKELIEGAQPVQPQNPSSRFEAPAAPADPALSETRTILADSSWGQRARVPGRSIAHDATPPAYVDMSIVWVDGNDDDAPANESEPALAE